jgi:L-alanine-DL-glutamate epimerase-like enolase superfamily enzyme
MRITAVETIRCDAFPNMLWVRLHAGELTGLGETYRHPRSVEAYVHEVAAPYLLGRDPEPLEAHWQALGAGMASHAIGVESRARSAVDLALWDLYGKRLGRPVHRCLGGPVRDAIRVYNTCAGYGYNVRRTHRPGERPSLAWETRREEGPYEDLAAWRGEGRAADVARSLLDMGITAMKIWPFDDLADETDGQYITPRQLERGLEPFRRIREAVGLDVDIAVELHSRWNLPSAIRIAEALEEIRPMWYEDPLRMDNADALATFSRSTRVPTTASETLAGRAAFRELLERRAVGIVMLDPGWVGGISEARRIAALAETYRLPVAPHDCTGPLVYLAGVQLCMATPNAMIQEGVRAYYTGWYREVVDRLPDVEQGWARPPDAPGLGADLRPEFLDRPDVSVRRSG